MKGNINKKYKMEAEMKGYKRVIILIVIIVFIRLYSASITEASPEGDYIYIKRFENKIINVILDTVIVSKKKAIEMGWSAEFIEEQKGDRVIVEYPKIIEEQIDTSNYQDIRRFKLLGPEGDILLEREYNYKEEGYCISNNKKYIMFSERLDEYDMDLNTRFYDEYGNLLWEKNSFRHFTDILDNGISIGGYGVYFNKYGEEIGMRPIIKPYPEFISIGVIDDNNIFYSFRWYGNKSIVMVTDSMGNEKWSKELPYKFASPNEYDLDPEIGIVGIYEKYNGKKTIYIDKLKRNREIEDWETGLMYINNNGIIQWKKDLQGIGDVRILLDKSNKKIYLMSSFGIILCIDLKNGEIIWEFTTNTFPDVNEPIFADKNRIRLKNIYLKNDELIIKSILPKEKENIIYRINKYNGKIIDKIIYKNENILMFESIHGIQINKKSERCIYINREK